MSTHNTQNQRYVGSQIVLCALVYKHRKHGFSGSVCSGAGWSWLLELIQELANNVLKWFLFFPTTWIKKECWVAQRSPVEACPCVYQKQSKWDNFLVQKELWLKSLLSINVQPDPSLALKLSEHKPNHLGSEAQKLHNLVVMMITIMMMGSVKMDNDV